MKLWVAWASGRRVRRSVKNSAILPAVVGVSSIFKRGTCSLSVVKEGKWGIQEMGAPGPVSQPLCVGIPKGLRATPPSPKYSPTGYSFKSLRSPGTYPGWPDPAPSGPRTGWALRPSINCPGGWLHTGCSRYLRGDTRGRGSPTLSQPSPRPILNQETSQ